MKDTDVHTDGRGRVLDASGRPLRDKDSRSYGREPFQGRAGKPHPKQKKLDARQKAFDSMNNVGGGYHRPGSYKK